MCSIELSSNFVKNTTKNHRNTQTDVVNSQFGIGVKKGLKFLGLRGIIVNVTTKPKWWNWQTRTTQNRVGLSREGSTPSFGTMFPKWQVQMLKRL